MPDLRPPGIPLLLGLLTLILNLFTQTLSGFEPVQMLGAPLPTFDHGAAGHMYQLYRRGRFIHFLSARPGPEHKGFLQVLFVQTQLLHSTLHAFPR